jgi:acetyl-CoA carboxylase carboxyltransferase component
MQGERLGEGTTAGKIEGLERLREAAANPAPEQAVERQRERGKLTARERIELLLDPETFVELDRYRVHRSYNFGLEENKPLGDGVITGYGEVMGRKVCVFSQDFTVFGGSLGEVYAQKICKVMDLALSTGCPIIGINDSGGARIQEGVVSLAGYADIFHRNVLASGVIPQVSVVMGPCAGGAVYSPAITDFVFMVEGTSHMFITGPDVIKSVTGEEVSFEDLGGAGTHNTRSGVAHFAAPDEESCLADVRYLLSFLPENNLETAPYYEPADSPERMDEELATLVPDSPQRPYDIRRAVELVVDDGEFYEVQEGWAQNLVVGFARLDGHAIGVVGNQPRTDQEWGGIIRHGAKLLYAFSEATVPKMTVITRKAYGGAYDVMCSRHIGADVNVAWPTGEIAVMGAPAAVNIIFRRQISEAEDPDAKREELIESYEEQFNNPMGAAEMGYIDDVIDPRETRPYLIKALQMVGTKRPERPPRKHGNIPL